MHRTSITEAALIETLLFSTVAEMPPGEPLFWQIFTILVVLLTLIAMIEYARWCEKTIRERRRRDDKRKSI